MPAATLVSLLVVCVSASTAAGERAAGPAESLRSSLGLQGVVDVDPLTGTPRVVARLDGFLTGPSADAADAIVLDYVRAQEAVFGLDGDDLAGLRLVRDETDAFGVRHLLWAQEAGGIRAVANDLRASVTADGRILKTEIVVGGERRVPEKASVTVTFRFEPSVQLWVPDVMMEEYVQPRRRGRSTTISGRAVYSQPRRLDTPGRGRLRPWDPSRRDPP